MSDISVKTITTFTVVRAVPALRVQPDGTTLTAEQPDTETYGPYASIEVAGAVRDALAQRDLSGLIG